MTIQFAAEEDTGLILRFIKELADYEGMLSEVEATEPLLREWIFEKKKAEVLIGLEGGEPVGFALFFHNFSTFLGRAGIYLEDLYVRPEYRGRGCGTAFLGAGGWSCGVSTGISRVLSSTGRWELFPWMTGRYTGSPETSLRCFRNGMNHRGMGSR